MRNRVFHNSALSRNWWATVVRGNIAIAVGSFAWARPDIFWALLVLDFGAYAVADGLFAIVTAINAQGGSRATNLLVSVLGLVTGVIVVIIVLLDLPLRELKPTIRKDA